MLRYDAHLGSLNDLLRRHISDFDQSLVCFRAFLLIVPVRIAFLTPEYPSELPDAGGLATYVHRMAQLLTEFGHEPEVFVTSEKASATTLYEGVVLHRVGPDRQSSALKLASRVGRRLLRVQVWNGALDLLIKAHALARSLQRRHAIAPFDVVQSAASRGAGLFVRRRHGRLHAVRCSYDSDLWGSFEQNVDRFASVRGSLERLTMRRADVAYGPSSYLSEHIRRTHGINLRVVRPPMMVRTPELVPIPFHLPNRFFIHFGQIRPLKGSALLAKALPIAWESAPDLTMIWSGVCHDPTSVQRWQASWGLRAPQVRITGPLPRAQLYGILRQADAAVLPSQVDNLPNTVIESLSLGIPVVGSRGASIDELVEEGVTGHLVELGDAEGLGRALARMWQRATSVTKGFKWQSDIVNEMKPESAVSNLIQLYKNELSS